MKAINRMMQSFSNIKLTKTQQLLIASGLTLSGLQYLGQSNYNVYKKSLEVSDQTRNTNASYGLSFAFQTDSAIEEILDTGDIFFVKYNCFQMFSCQQILKCSKDFIQNKIVPSQLGQEFNDIAIAIRDKKGVKIIYVSPENGKVQVENYNEWLAKPYNQIVILKRLIIKKASTQQQTDSLNQNIASLGNKWIKLFKNYNRVQNGIVKEEQVKQDVIKQYEKELKLENGSDLFKHFLLATQLLNENQVKNLDLDQDKTQTSTKFLYTGPVIIRTQFSRSRETQ